LLQYVTRRILMMIPVLIGVTLVTFILMNVVPGDPVIEMLGKRTDPETIAMVRKELGLDAPLHIQYLRFVAGALRGDLGMSYKLRQPVTALIMRTFPTTAKLALSAAAVAIAIGLTVGIISAVKQYSFLDHATMVATLTAISAPVFWVAMIAQLVFGYYLRWFPISGYYSPWHMVLPAIVLGTRFSASIARLTRTTMLDVIRQDYVRTARAKGLAEKIVIYSHALRNAMIPIVTIIGMQISGLLTGSFFTETVFAIPGLGSLAVKAMQQRDFPLMQGTVLFGAVVLCVGILIVDISYAYLDPRIRLE